MRSRARSAKGIASVVDPDFILQSDSRWQTQYRV